MVSGKSLLGFRKREWQRKVKIKEETNDEGGEMLKSCKNILVVYSIIEILPVFRSLLS